MNLHKTGARLLGKLTICIVAIFETFSINRGFITARAKDNRKENANFQKSLLSIQYLATKVRRNIYY